MQDFLASDGEYGAGAASVYPAYPIQMSCHEQCSRVFAWVNETVYPAVPLTQRSAVHWCC
jgi:hypothetical protein